MARCTVHLYFPPGWELGLDDRVDPTAVARLGTVVQARCLEASRAVTALSARGWTWRSGRYDLVGEKECDRPTALRDFLRAGLDPVALALEEAGPAR